MKLSEDIKPVTQLKTGAAKVLQELKQRRRPVVITQNGKASAVMLDVVSYERMKNAALMMRLLSMSEADVSAGRVHSHDEVFGELSRRLKRKRK
ncbi:MAG: type II toxin-antitoxin system Phd/YefM family antitoxin [Myxococcaceae bacterium]|nr:type II toxin-antitoxin system Phd/YefM family antitoxin [Myxococcaceae bacterium]